MNSGLSRTSSVISRVVGTVGALAFALGGAIASAATHCYDFSGPEVGTTYAVGETVNARHSTIHLQELMTENGPMNPGRATIEQTDLPLGQAPALGLSGIVTQVVPQNRVQAATFKFAENTGSDDQQIWNFGVNGERRIWRGRLSDLNGQYLGKPKYGGRVRILVSAQADSSTLPTWVKGTLTLEADPVNPLVPNRGIGVFAMGRSSQLKVDDVCLTE